jgi:hypothetical protein
LRVEFDSHNAIFIAYFLVKGLIMIKKHTFSFKAAKLALCLLAFCKLSGEAYARGSFPELVAPGQCTISPDGTARLVARKSQDRWQVAIEVIGPTSVGDWSIRFAKNNAWVAPSLASFPPPGGWAFIGASTNAADKGNVVTYSVEATNLATNDICTGSIGFKVK